MKLNTRLQLRYDLLSAWQNSTLALLAGEVAIAKDGDNLIIKVGEDGIKTWGQLPVANVTPAELAALAERVATLEADLNTATTGLKARVTAAEEAIAGIQELLGDGDGSVKDQIADAVAAEAELRVAADNAINAKIGTVAENTTVVGLIDAETARADAAEKANAKAIADEIARADAAEKVNAKAIADETTRATGAEGALADRIKTIEDDYLVAADIANFETKEEVKKVADDLAAYKTANDAAVALKADKSVVDAMYTNAQIDGFIADAKKYADDNDANTTYTIGYESKVDGEDGHPARIVLTPSEGEAQYIDATPFIKDGMLDNVAYNEATNTLTFTFNTDAGKEAVTVELTDILAPYTGSTGDRVKVEVTDGVISADLVAGSIGKDYLDDAVKASLAKADSALQSHQSLEHLATKEELKAVSDVADAARTEAEVNSQIDAKIAALDLANTYDAKGAAATAESNAKGHADGLNTAMDTRVKALEENKADYATKTEAQGYANAAQTAAEGKVTELANGAVAVNTAAIAAINHGTTGILAQAKNYTDALANGAVKNNTDAIAAINSTTDGILVKAKAYTDQEVGKLAATVATTEKLGLVKASDTVAVAADGKMSVAKVSTDVLVQGTQEVILHGGNATGYGA